MKRGAVVLAAIVVAVDCLVGLACGTQWMAWRLHQPAVLGPAWRGVYAPWALVEWTWWFRHTVLIVRVVRDAWCIAGGATAVATVTTMPMLAWRRRARALSGAYGTAVWDAGERLVRERGLVLGWKDDATRVRSGSRS
jgi:hypothetical protein